MSKGFTIIELSLYAAIAAIVLGVVVGIQLTVERARIKQAVISEVEQQATQALTQITQAVRNSQAVSSPGQGSSAASLELASFDGATNPTIINESGGTLLVCEGSGCTPIALTASDISISDLAFDNVARPGTAGIIRVHFTASYNNTANRNEYNWSNTYYASAAIRQP